MASEPQGPPVSALHSAGIVHMVLHGARGRGGFSHGRGFELRSL